VRRRKRFQPPPYKKLELTPMIDVTFLLLIFFMLTIQFRDEEGILHAALPKQDGVGGEPAIPVERVRVEVLVEQAGTRLELESDTAWDGSGPYRYGDDRRLGYRVGPSHVASLDAVRNRLSDLRTSIPDLKMLIQPAAGTIYADVVPVLDLGRLVGFESISFSGAR